ncbi:MAG: phosphoserine phosphatase SerB [Pseudomonadota bacterium]
MTAYILTLIGPNETEIINSTYVEHVSKEVSQVTKPNWLNPDQACEIGFTCSKNEDLETLQASLRDYIAAEPIDMAIRLANAPRKKLLIADMDSTIIQQECIDEIAGFANVRDHVADITEQAMRGELDFDEALKERVALLEGLDIATLEQVFAERIQFTSGAHTLVQTMRHHGAFCALVSGGFTFFTSRVAQHVGFHINQANVLETQNEVLTGKVIEPILGKEAKREALQNLCEKQGVDVSDSLAVGDGANDLEMIKLSGLGVAYHAKPIVAKQADVRINHTDLTSLLYIQGYNKREFVEE